MGFKREATHYKLKFEDPALQGLEVVAKALPLRDFFEINRLANDPNSDNETEQATIIFKKFAGALVSWNLEDENGPVPATYEGVVDQELVFVNTIIQAWMEAIASVPKASNTTSNGGGTYQELSLPMEVS